MKSLQENIKIIVVFLIIVLFAYFALHLYQKTKIENLAKCMSDKGMTFYGSSWCPHCKLQRELFGTSFKLVNYVECSNDESVPMSDECKKLGIEKFPTWILRDGSSSTLTGVQSLFKLSVFTKCEL